MSTSPPSTLLTLDEALSRLLGAVLPLQGIETVSTFDALGRVLAADLRSIADVPAADNSAMDGYALRCADVSSAGIVLPVSQRVPAGTVGGALKPGTAARIFTGAFVPEGADAVVMQEDCEALEAAIIGALDVFGEAAGGELPHAQVVVQALAADAVLFAARVGAVAEPCVARLLAFHGLGVVRSRCGVNSG